jgi:hypothetical protein
MGFGLSVESYPAGEACTSGPDCRIVNLTLWIGAEWAKVPQP